ncbi:unnamed protein product [Nezara viridula]|uniref:Uncharacterized protein n=1 Tax=Nezara viridula TaxID=85310 RepID=A0A9P0MR26_NEZVI|nr:unnamed protein product [Nezara viridula]
MGRDTKRDSALDSSGNLLLVAAPVTGSRSGKSYQLLPELILSIACWLLRINADPVASSVDASYYPVNRTPHTCTLGSANTPALHLRPPNFLNNFLHRFSSNHICRPYGVFTCGLMNDNSIPSQMRGKTLKSLGVVALNIVF